MKRSHKRVVLYLLDVTMITIAHISAYMFLLAYSQKLHRNEIIITLLVALFIYSILGIKSKIFSIINRFTDYKTIFKIITNIFIAFFIAYVTDLVLIESFSRRFIFLSYLFATFLVLFPRIFWRIWHEVSPFEKKKKKNIKNGC